MVTTHRIRALSLVLIVLSVLLGPALAGPAVAFGEPGVDPVGAWPLRPEPEVVARFDLPDSPYGAGHRGVDLAGSVGQVVRSALPGRVTYAGSIAGRGVVVVDHGATRTTYEPVAASVPLGTSIARGDPIGTLELGGSHCFPRTCLHWGWISGGGSRATPTSTLCAWSVSDPSGCCRCGARHRRRSRPGWRHARG